MTSPPPEPAQWTPVSSDSAPGALVEGLPTSIYDRYPAGRIDARARNALILGSLALVPLSILTGIPAIIVGYRSLRRIEASEGALRGRAAAILGITFGCVSILVLIGFAVAART